MVLDSISATGWGYKIKVMVSCQSSTLKLYNTTCTMFAPSNCGIEFKTCWYSWHYCFSSTVLFQALLHNSLLYRYFIEKCVLMLKQEGDIGDSIYCLILIHLAKRATEISIYITVAVSFQRGYCRAHFFFSFHLMI